LQPRAHYSTQSNRARGDTCAADLLNTTGFAGLPLTPPDPRFGTITEISSSNVGNYNGLTLSLQRRFASLQFQANYTYSHALTMISNGGFLPFNFNTNESTANPQDPFNFRRYNYGNADYDVRHNASLNYVWTTPKLSGWKGALASWTVSGTLFWRSGLPITAYDDNGSGVLSGFNYAITNGDPLFANYCCFANYLGSGSVVCTRAAILPVSGAGSPCLSAGPQFTGLQSPDPSTPITTFGNQHSNQIWGPHYFDTDLTLMKNFHFPPQ